MYNAQFVSALKEALNGLRTIHSVGEEWCSYIGQIPVGGVPYCGQEVTRSTYSALWQYAQNQGLVKSESEWQSIYSAQGGNVPFYSSGDGSSTFRMPRLVGYVRGASGQSEAGAYVKEGLPNITGDLTDKIAIQNAYTQTLVTGTHGAFGMTQAMGTYGGYGSDDKTVYLDFDASRCSPVYGNSDHVTPETSCVLFGVYAFGEVSNVDALDAGTLASAVAKVEANLESKLDDGDKEKIIDWVMPNYAARSTFSFGSSIKATEPLFVWTGGDGYGYKPWGVKLSVSSNNSTWYVIDTSKAEYVNSQCPSVQGFVPKNWYYKIEWESTAGGAPTCYRCPLMGG